ncbi:MAG: hypothetical protein ACYS5V_00945 [Planctomycetota bacterium]|jgi:hypothetical protein
MKLTRRLAALIACLLLRTAPRTGNEGDAARREGFSTHPGGKGLRFTERLRSAFRRRWLRLKSH